MTIDPSHPFPRVLNKALCIALLLRHKRHDKKKSSAVTGTDGDVPRKHTAPRVLGVVTVPRSLPRLVRCRFQRRTAKTAGWITSFCMS